MYQSEQRSEEPERGTFLFFRHRFFLIQKMIAAWYLFRAKCFRTDETADMSLPEAELLWENPFLPYARMVIEQILKQKKLDYRDFRPILIDTDCPNQVFGEADDVDQVLAQLEQGLNFLEICTDRPDYFSEWKNRMEEEYGLIVRLVGKSWESQLYGNVVLDFERYQPMRISCFDKHVIYLPFQKRKWDAKTSCESDEEEEFIWTKNTRKTARVSDEKPGGKSETEVLDINVPIGYNRIIVEVESIVF